jgi:DNA-binding PadR family transcriptional regulator/Sec-independent protein translocase protein TatA
MSVRHALLALLSEGPKYGLQLREEFEARTGEVWPLNVGQVYTTLQRLERDGLVESDDDADQDGPQKGFRITTAGEHELTAWLRTPPDLASPPRDELVMKVLVALRVPGTDVHEVIQVHRRYVVEVMQQWTRIKETEAESDMSLALVVDAELYRLDSVIRWLDSADGRIKRAAADTETQATETQATETQATETQATETQATETQATETQAGTTQAAKTQAAKTQTKTQPSTSGAMPSVRRRIGGRK